MLRSWYLSNFNAPIVKSRLVTMYFQGYLVFCFIQLGVLTLVVYVKRFELHIILAII